MNVSSGKGAGVDNEAASVGVVVRAEEPPGGANCAPSGGSAAAELVNEAASVGVDIPPPRRTSSSIAERKAASVLPEPVGAAIRTFLPDWMSGQARTCGSVAAAKCLANQASTAG